MSIISSPAITGESEAVSIISPPVITGESDEAYNDIEFSPAIAEQIVREHGADVKARFEKIGFSFEAGQDG